MPVDHTEIKQAIHTIMNDVVEQCFHYMVHYPEHGDVLNRIIQEASDDIRVLNERVDQTVHTSAPHDLEVHLSVISKDLHKRSLVLLSRLQKLQNGEYENEDQRNPDSKPRKYNY